MSISVWNDYEQSNGMDYDLETRRWYYPDEYEDYESEIYNATVDAFQEPGRIISIADESTGNQIGSVEVNIEEATIVDIDTLYVDTEPPLESAGYYSVGEIYPDSGNTDTQQNNGSVETVSEANKNPAVSLNVNDPENTAQDAVATVSGQMKAAGETVEVILTEQANSLKASAAATLQLSDGLIEGVVMFEEGYLPEKYARYYAENLDELKKTIGGIQTEGMKLADQYSDTVGKSYAAGMIAKGIGGVGTAIDWIEMGKRVSTAVDGGNWDPVYGQAAKMVTAFTAGLGVVGVARGAALVISGIFGGGAIATTAITFVGAAALTFIVSETADYIGSQISQGKLSEFLGGKKPDELAIVGNIGYSGDTLIEADDVTLIGNHHFENLEVNSQNLTVIGDIQSEGRLIINSGNTEIISADKIAEDFINAERGNNEHSDTEGNTETVPADTVPEEDTDTPDGNTDNIADAESADSTQSLQNYLQELDGLFGNGNFDISAHMRAMDGTATAADLEYLAAHEIWMEYRQPAYADTANTPATPSADISQDMAAINLIQ